MAKSIPDDEYYELVALAQSINNQVWKGRDADHLSDDEVPMAMATRELWQRLSSYIDLGGIAGV